MSTTWKQVVLDVADAWREANDSTAKIPVGQLPNKVKEGGENIDPELTTLEGTLQEILEILPFKGAMASGRYVWKKLTAEGGDLVEFVISNDSTTYPNGGMQDGYWYELVEGELTAEMLGYNKIILNSAVFSSNVVTNQYNFAHGLEEIPKFLMVFAKGIDRSTTDYSVESAVVLNGTQASSASGLMCIIGTNGTIYDKTGVTASCNASTINIYYGTNVNYRAGVEYTFIVGA